MSATRHVPVLADEVVAWLAPERGGLFVDVTVGLGGHAEAVLEAGPRARLLGIDRDVRALALAGERLARFGDRVELVEGRFGDLSDLLGGRRVDGGILADLGVSSLQLDEAERGFAFRFDAPLDMRMGRSEVTAADVVNGYGETELTEIFREYGEEKMAARIARGLVRARQERPVETTRDLADLVHRIKGRDKEGRIDSATRVFQALRMEVNEELLELERLLEGAVRLLEQEGRLVVISYHSLEDRQVKNAFRRLARGEADPVTGRPREETRLLDLLTRRAVRPRPEEIEANPRARSARLRAARRIDGG